MIYWNILLAKWGLLQGGLLQIMWGGGVKGGIREKVGLFRFWFFSGICLVYFACLLLALFSLAWLYLGSIGFSWDLGLLEPDLISEGH